MSGSLATYLGPTWIAPRRSNNVIVHVRILQPSFNPFKDHLFWVVSYGITPPMEASDRRFLKENLLWCVKIISNK